MKKTFFIILLVLSFSVAARQRVIILTDISAASQEPDDIESMVRLMLYSNEMDIEGLIATSSCWRKNDPLRPDLIESIVDAYGTVRSNLLLHDDRYPDAELLKATIRSGNGHGMAAVGNGNTSEGSRMIAEIVDRTDERPVWVCIWGGAATLAQTLHDVREARSDAEVDRFISRLRVYDLSGQDDAGAWICHNFREIFYIRSRVQWRGFSYRIDNLWDESRGPHEELVSPSWFLENISTGHGALGAMYAPAKYLHEGDTPTFLNLLDNGLSAQPDSIHFGGWGGRFMIDKEKNVRTGSDNSTVVESGYFDYYMFTDATDRWTEEGREYENSYCAVFRWREACQNDFAARMDWCVTAYADANHPPVAVVNGEEGTGCIRISVAPGTAFELDAAGSNDPDGDAFSCKWWVYQEAGTYDGNIELSTISGAQTVVTAPDDCVGKTFHIILTLEDRGTPELCTYRRIIVTGQQPETVKNVKPYVAYGLTHSTDRSAFFLNGQRVHKRRNSTAVASVRVMRSGECLLPEKIMDGPCRIGSGNGR